jgi:uncharacterized protein
MGFQLIVIQPTSLCNLNCAYCYVPNRKDKFKVQAADLEIIIQKVLSSSLVGNRVEFLWHAGEPLLMGVDFYQKAYELTNKYNTQKREIKHAFQTNAVLINGEWCKFFKETKANVGVSIDGPKFIHDGQRKKWGGKGSFDEAIRGYRLLREHDVRTGCIAVLTAESLNYPDEMFEFFLDEKFTWLGFNVEEIENGNLSTSYHTKKDTGIDNSFIEKYRKFMGRLFELWLAHDRKLEIREFFIKTTSIEQKLSDKNYVYFRDENKDLGILTIQKNGDLSTHSPEFAGAKSAYYKDFVVGNIFRMDKLEELLENDTYKLIKREVHEGLQNCANECKYFDLCGGGSPSNKFFENGSLKSTVNNTCRLHQMTLSDLVIKKLTAMSAGKSQPLHSA